MAPKSVMFTERVSTYLTKEQLAKVREEAIKLGMDVSGFIRMVILKEVNRNGESGEKDNENDH